MSCKEDKELVEKIQRISDILKEREKPEFYWIPVKVAEMLDKEFWNLL